VTKSFEGFDRDEARTSLSGGINYRQEMKSKGFEFSIGLEWIDSGSKYTLLTFGDQIADPGGSIFDPNFIDDLRIINRLRYLSIPLLWSYGKSTQNEKWNCTASLGGSPDIFIYRVAISKYITEDGNQRFRKRVGGGNFNPVLFSARGELSIERTLSEKISVFSDLAYRRGITAHAKKKKNDFRSSNYGVKIGLRYRLGESEEMQ
ncbi:MAG: hypothetical protein ACI8YO_002520, partial [Gammaproteobacteria bacterium]